MKRIFLILIILISGCTSNVFAKKCNIYKCSAWQVKVCGEEIYCRDYSCENNQWDKLIKKYREEYTEEKGNYPYCNDEWCGLKPYVNDHIKECPVVWGECYEEKIFKKYLKKCGEKTICDIYTSNWICE